MPKSSHLAFLVTEFGKPFVSAGFGNWFRDQCNAASLPKNLSAHGLRKAGATRLSEHWLHGSRDHGMGRVDNAQGGLSLHQTSKAQAACSERSREDIGNTLVANLSNG
jgi:hypothetical protein